MVFILDVQNMMYYWCILENYYNILTFLTIQLQFFVCMFKTFLFVCFKEH